MKAKHLSDLRLRVLCAFLGTAILLCILISTYDRRGAASPLPFQSSPPQPPKPPQQLPCGSMVVLFPTGFLDEWYNAYCDMTNDRSIPARGLIPIGPRFLLGVWTATGPARDLKKPITLLIDLDPSVFSTFGDTSLSAYIYREASQTWVRIPSHSSITDHQVVADLAYLEPTSGIVGWNERSLIGVFAEVLPTITPTSTPALTLSPTSSPSPTLATASPTPFSTSTPVPTSSPTPSMVPSPPSLVTMPPAPSPTPIRESPSSLTVTALFAVVAFLVVVVLVLLVVVILLVRKKRRT